MRFTVALAILIFLAMPGYARALSADNHAVMTAPDCHMGVLQGKPAGRMLKGKRCPAQIPVFTSNRSWTDIQAGLAKHGANFSTCPLKGKCKGIHCPMADVHSAMSKGCCLKGCSGSGPGKVLSLSSVTAWFLPSDIGRAEPWFESFISLADTMALASVSIQPALPPPKHQSL